LRGGSGVSGRRVGACGWVAPSFGGISGDAGADSLRAALRAWKGDVQDCGRGGGVAVCEAFAAGFEEGAEPADRAFPRVITEERVDTLLKEAFTASASKFST